MKAKVWINGNKQLMESGHKTFDRQTNCIGTGNVIANTQYSGYIRAYYDLTNPVGQAREPGYLQDYDLEKFDRLPGHIRQAVKQAAIHDSVILYEWHTWGPQYNDSTWRGRVRTGKQTRTIHGYTLTSPGHHFIKTWTTGPTEKSYGIVAEATKYVVEEQ